MKTIIKSIPLLLGLALFLGGCSTENIYEGGDHFFVKNAGAEMPVYIKGNLESRIFILFLHGGPGGNSTSASFLPVSQELEQDYAFAYWDQRASGLSQGNPDESTLTVDQFVEDLDLVIESINKRHNNPTIVLFGISWGGALGSAYLSTGNYQDKVDGFINMDSGHNLLEGLPKSVIWVKEYAQKQLEEGLDTVYWTEVYDWCATVPDMTVPDNYFKFEDYLDNTNASRRDPNQEVESAQIGFSEITNSYMSFALFFNGKWLAERFNILELNLSPRMEIIKVPTIVIWGRHDGINTIEMGFDAFNSIGGPDFTGKEMLILENSAHQGYVEEQDLFQMAFRSFVDGL